MSNAGNTATKYAWIIGSGILLVILMRITGIIESLMFGLTVLTVMGGLIWVAAVLPESRKQARTACFTLAALVAFGCFIAYPLWQMVEPHIPFAIKRAYKTRVTATHLSVVNQLHKAGTSAQEQSEELCRTEVDRLTEGPESEVAATIKEFKEHVAQYKGQLNILVAERKPMADMSAAEMLATLASNDPVDRYYALLHKLQIQAKRAPKVYELCLHNAPKPAEKTAGVRDPAQNSGAATHAYNPQDFSTLFDVQNLRDRILKIGYGMALVLIFFAALLGSKRRHTGSTVVWCIALAVAGATTIFFFLSK